MSFRKCIQGKIDEGKLDKDKGEKILKDYNRQVERFKVHGHGEIAAQQAAQKIWEIEAAKVERRQRNAKNAAIWQANKDKDFKKHPGRAAAVTSDALQKAAYKGKVIMQQAERLFSDAGDELGADWAALSRDHGSGREAVKFMLGGKVEDPNARAAGEAMQRTLKYAHTRLRQAGGEVGEVPNYFPQIHSKEAILRSGIGKDEWVKTLRDALDISKHIDEDTGLPFKESKLKKIMEDNYDTIVTDGVSDLKRMDEKGEMPAARRRGDVDVRHDNARFYHFKDADAFLDYNAKFGVGDEGLVAAFRNKMQSMTRDIGILEELGPRPDASMRFMDFKMQVDGTSKFKQKWANAEYRVLAGKLIGGDVESMWWKMFTGTHAWLRSAMLGTAPISGLGDTAVVASTAKINGLDSVAALQRQFKMLNPLADRESKAILKQMGFHAEVLGGAALDDSRFAGEALDSNSRVTKGINWLAGATHQASGLAYWTRRLQDTLTMEGTSKIARDIGEGLSWDKMHPDLKQSLERFGFNELDWLELRLSDSVIDNGQAKILMTSELRNSKEIPAARAHQIADKLDMWIMSMRESVTSEPTLATKALTTGAILGDGGAATPSRVIGASLGLFKSFPLTVMMSHFLPSLERAGILGDAKFNIRKADQLAMVMIGSTIMGAAAIQAREMIKGKTPRDAWNYKFLMASILQGGGMGLFGDFAFGDYSRFDRNPITEALGPGVGLFEDIYKATKGNLDGWATSRDGDLSDVPKSVAGDLFRVAKRNIPLGSLWYGRLAVERLVLDNLERLIDPNFDRRIGKYERKMKKETGQEFWWSPR